MTQIRRATANDTTAVSAIYAHYVQHSVATFDEHLPELNTTQSWLADERFPVLVACVDQRVVAFAGLHQHSPRLAYRWSANCAVYCDQAYCGRGIGRALYQILVPAAHRMGYHNLLAGIALPNPGSLALHRAFGFEQCAHYRRIGFKHGRWIDTLWLQKHLGDQQAATAPAALTLLSELSDHALGLPFIPEDE